MPATDPLTDPLTAAVLGLLCLVLVGPGPLWVVRWRFLTRVPRAAVVLWQAGTVAALVSLLTAGTLVGHQLVRIAVEPAAVRTRPPWWQVALSGLIVAFTLVVIARLVWSLFSVIRSTRQRRARHRTAVDLLGRAEAGDAARALSELSRLGGLRVLAGETPVAYCLPGLRDHRVVVSEGTLDRLDRDELTAVLAHETAHVRSRHDIVLDTFTALHRAFPIAVRSEIPAQECTLLVEMLADDAARRTTGPLPLARALVSLAGSPVPHAALGAGGPLTPTRGRTGPDALLQRIARLGPEQTSSSGPLAAAVYALAVALVVSPLAVVAAVGILR